MKGPNKKVESDRRRRRCVLFNATVRRSLKAFSYAADLAESDRIFCMDYLDSFPRSSSHTRLRNRCIVTGRPRGVFRHVRLTRHFFKNYALAGLLFGIRKSSW
jgi:small subunit ribosomal protein S14